MPEEENFWIKAKCGGQLCPAARRLIFGSLKVSKSSFSARPESKGAWSFENFYLASKPHTDDTPVSPDHMLESHWGRCEVWAHANMNYNEKLQRPVPTDSRYSSKESGPFPSWPSDVCTRPRFWAAFVPRSFHQKHLQRGGHKRTSKHQWNGYCQHLSIQWHLQNPSNVSFAQ